MVLAAVLIEIDSAGYDWDLSERFPRLFGAGAEGSRGLLAAIAGSMITVAGTTFSITIVALAQASSQYTSRILRNFMRDRASQVVLGVFVGVFAYCLIVLRTIRGGDENVFVPPLAVLGGLALAFVAIGFLIFFIHHIAESIQASNVIAEAADETLWAVDRLFPEDVGAPANEASDAGRRAELESLSWYSIAATNTGYIQAIDADALFELARKEDAVLRMELGVGEFVTEGCPLASIAAVRPDEDRVRDLNAAYTIARFRTVHQDAAYGIRQIVDVALKALSPGINDTTTAVNCIDYLGAILSRVADRVIETPFRKEEGEVRLIVRGPTFARMVDESFDQIRQNADGNVAILSRLLQVLRTIAGRTADSARRQVLVRQADLVVEASRRSVPATQDLSFIQVEADRFATAVALGVVS